MQPGPGVVLVNALARLTIYFLLGGGLALIAYFGEGRRREQAHQQPALAAERGARQASELKLGVLQVQVEPYFLFNTLAAMRPVIREDPARAEATLDALVDYLRAAIPRLRRRDDALDAALGRQLELCRAYLAVLQLTMGDRLAVEEQVDAALASLPLPPLMLIALVENAIKHGLEPKRGAGRLTISARRDGAQLKVEVRDDGVGLGELPGSGVGLANIREQLALRYGGRGSLEVRAHRTAACWRGCQCHWRPRREPVRAGRRGRGAAAPGAAGDAHPSLARTRTDPLRGRHRRARSRRRAAHRSGISRHPHARA